MEGVQELLLTRTCWTLENGKTHLQNMQAELKKEITVVADASTEVLGWYKRPSMRSSEKHCEIYALTRASRMPRTMITEKNTCGNKGLKDISKLEI